MKDLISIIIPVYKVEKYIKKCIDSIICQSYRNLEIILIDDGSPDESGKICDQYATIDNRIKVIHQKNGGLSAARNAGIKVAKGKYIAFVDSDDYIKSDMISNLYDDINKEKADISICGYYLVKDDVVSYCEHCNEKFTLSGIEAMNHLYDDYCVLTSLAWNKLYKREVFKYIKFAEGKVHEDDIIILDILKVCKKISFNLKPEYYYIQRTDSITGNFKVNRLDGLYALEIRDDYFKSIKRDDLIDLNNYKKYYIVTTFIKNARKVKNKDDLLKEKIKECKKKKIMYYSKIKKSNYLSFKRKVFVNISFYFQIIYDII